MTQQVLEKRTYDRRTHTIDCTKLLDDAETIVSITSIVADQGGMTFGVPIVNIAPVTFPDGSTAAIGKAVQVRILDGVIPAGVLFLLCTLRVRMVTTIDPQLEATVLLRLTDQAYSQ